MKNKILGFVIALLMTLTITSADAIAQIQSPRNMEGSWKVIITPGQAPIPLPPAIESVVTFVPGGGLIESDNLAVPNTIAGSGQGAWEYVERRRFSFVFTKYLFTTQGLFQGSVKITETITVNSNEDQYTGVGSMQVLSPTGATLFTIPLTTQATRIRVFNLQL